jgi:hypothetical protein
MLNRSCPRRRSALVSGKGNALASTSSGRCGAKGSLMTIMPRATVPGTNMVVAAGNHEEAELSVKEKDRANPAGWFS